MKKIAILIILILSFQANSQDNSDYTFGKVSQEELDLKKYKLDSTANALVLYESGITVFKLKKNTIIISTKFYKKIKIFNKEGYKHATFSVSLYNNKKNSEKIEKINAITHNHSGKTKLFKDQIFEERINENWRELKFTMPNLNDGSIVEVEYTIESPFKFNLTGWEFQSDIPKNYSLYKASIPGNYLYNRKLSGYLKLKINSAIIKKNCFNVPGQGIAGCEKLTYAIKDIPAFKAEEYMTDGDNFKSKIKFELTEFKWFDGTNQKYTTTWNAVDKEFRTDKNIGGQIRKTKFFKDHLPQEIIAINSDLKKAKAVFYFIQNHFTWNEKYSIFKNVKVKSAYENKAGNVGEINISLINALKAAGLDVKLVLLSTRENGFATKLYPVISDFNYVIAKVNINGKSYLLDATDKFIPFGFLPYRCLNGSGRVMDFKNESYWFDIEAPTSSKSQLTANLILNDDGTINGKLRKTSFGYDAIARRKEIANKTNDDVISEFENRFNNLETINYTFKNKTEVEKPLIETIEVEIDDLDSITTKYLNPFFEEQFKTNPFKQENRLYPVDFGYAKKFNLNFSLKIADNYKFKSFPKLKSISLPKNGGSFTYLIKKVNENQINLISKIAINKPIFYNSEYEFLKEFFKIIINKQAQLITINKKQL